MDVEALDETVTAVPGVHVAQLVEGEDMSVQYYRIEPGAEVPIHNHHHEQTGFVFEGTLTYFFEEGEDISVGPDGSYALASNEPHGAVNNGKVDVVGIDVFRPPRVNPDWAKD